jgi:CRP-like cAMP-binding protein
MATADRTDSPRPATVSRRTDALVASVTQHHRAVSAHQRRLLAAVAELNRRRAWRVDGATSMVAWLVQRCSVTASTAREWVTAAEKLESLPKISDALAQGKLSFDQVKPLVDVAKPETDAHLAEQATQWSAKQVRELAVAARNQSDEQAAGNYTRRFLRFNDGRRSFAGTLPEDQYAVVKGALTARVARRGRSRTPYDQRLSDALFEMARADGNAGPDRTNGSNAPAPTRPTVVVHADLRLLAGGQGQAELDVLGPLSPEVARRLACDARIVLSADDAAGRSIQQGGARRSPTPAQRLEIRRRDKGCRFPGCTYTEYTDVHHVVHWTANGPTDIPNLVTLCDEHHRAVHELGWKMSGDANIQLTFRSPTGRVTTSTPSPTFTRARAGPPG